MTMKANVSQNCVWSECITELLIFLYSVLLLKFWIWLIQAKCRTTPCVCVCICDAMEKTCWCYYWCLAIHTSCVRVQINPKVIYANWESISMNSIDWCIYTFYLLIFFSFSLSLPLLLLLNTHLLTHKYITQHNTQTVHRHVRLCDGYKQIAFYVMVFRFPSYVYAFHVQQHLVYHIDYVWSS